MTMLTLDFFADWQNGSGSNIGLPKRIGQIAFSSSAVASAHCCAVIVPAGACTAKWALSHWSGSPVVEPGSVQVPATQVADAGGVVAQPVAHAVVVVPGSHAPPSLPVPPLLLPPLPPLLLLPLPPPLPLPASRPPLLAPPSIAPELAPLLLAPALPASVPAASEPPPPPHAANATPRTTVATVGIEDRRRTKGSTRRRCPWGCHLAQHSWTRQLCARLQPAAPEHQQDGRRERDDAVHEPHRAGALLAVLRTEAREHGAGVESGGRLGEKPRDGGHAHVRADPVGRGGLGHPLVEARGPDGLAHRVDDLRDEQQREVRPARQQEHRRSANQCARDHHRQDVDAAGDQREQRRADEDDERVEPLDPLEACADARRVRADHVVGERQPLVREERAHREQREDEVEEAAVGDGRGAPRGAGGGAGVAASRDLRHGLAEAARERDDVDDEVRSGHAGAHPEDARGAVALAHERRRERLDQDAAVEERVQQRIGERRRLLRRRLLHACVEGRGQDARRDRHQRQRQPRDDPARRQRRSGGEQRAPRDAQQESEQDRATHAEPVDERPEHHGADRDGPRVERHGQPRRLIRHAQRLAEEERQDVEDAVVGRSVEEHREDADPEGPGQREGGAPPAPVAPRRRHRTRVSRPSSYAGWTVKTFRGGLPVGRMGQIGIGLLWAAMIIPLRLGIANVVTFAMAILALLALPLLFIPSRIEVADDGVFLRWLVFSRFVPYARMANVWYEPGVPRGFFRRGESARLTVYGKDGPQLTISSRAGSPDLQRAAQAIDAGMASYHASGQPAPFDSARLARGGAKAADWLSRIRALARMPASYRESPPSREELARILGDPRA